MAERSKRQCINRELSYWRFRMSSNPAAASSALWQGALSSLPSLSEETLSSRSPCIGVKEPTSLLAKEQGEIPVKWSDSQTYGNG